MDFSLTEEQELLLASIRELITTNFPEEYFRTCDQNGTYPREFMRALADNDISIAACRKNLVVSCGLRHPNAGADGSVKMRCSGIFDYQRSMYSQYAPFRFCRAAT